MAPATAPNAPLTPAEMEARKEAFRRDLRASLAKKIMQVHQMNQEFTSDGLKEKIKAYPEEQGLKTLLIHLEQPIANRSTKT